MSKYYRYSHERSSLLDILHQKKTKLIPDIPDENDKSDMLLGDMLLKENDKSYMLMNFLKKIVINLFGEKKIVDQASLEILTFLEKKSKNVAHVIYYPELLEKLTSKNSINQVIINKCYDMKFNNIIELNAKIIGSWKPYNLYVTSNCSNNNILNDCKLFNDIYNIHSEKMFKRDKIYKILD